jgi:hypothetical protein
MRQLSPTTWVQVAVIVLSSQAYGHGSHHHERAKATPTRIEQEAEILRRINTGYLNRVKPVFEKKCFDCHSGSTHFPWYYSIPGVRQFIDSDITEAREHLDMSKDFPFRGHGGPAEDLEAIGKSTEDGSMPPFAYRLLHRGSGLTQQEKALILEWVSSSKAAVEGFKTDR